VAAMTAATAPRSKGGGAKRGGSKEGGSNEGEQGGRSIDRAEGEGASLHRGTKPAGGRLRRTKRASAVASRAMDMCPTATPAICRPLSPATTRGSNARYLWQPQRGETTAHAVPCGSAEPCSAG